MAALYDDIGYGTNGRYPTFIHAVIEHGQFFDSQPRPKGIPKMANNMCFQNAGRHILDNYEGYCGDLIYVEGYADGNNILGVHHAWIYNADTLAMYDPTYPNKGYANRVYYGIPFSREFMIDHWRTHRIWDISSITDYLYDGFPTGAIRVT